MTKKTYVYKKSVIIFMITLAMGLVSACGKDNGGSNAPAQTALLASGAAYSQVSMSYGQLSFTIVANDTSMSSFRVTNIHNNGTAVGDQTISQNSQAYQILAYIFRGQTHLEQNANYGAQNGATVTVVDSSNQSHSYPLIDQYSSYIFSVVQQMIQQQQQPYMPNYCTPGYNC